MEIADAVVEINRVLEEVGGRFAKLQAKEKNNKQKKNDTAKNDEINYLRERLAWAKKLLKGMRIDIRELSKVTNIN